jgi:hypothetical protein
MDSMQRINKYLLFTVGNVFRIKWFHLGSKRYADDEEVETQAWKWLGLQSKNFYAAGFDELVNRLDKCINVDGGYVEK